MDLLKRWIFVQVLRWFFVFKKMLFKCIFDWLFFLVAFLIVVFLISECFFAAGFFSQVSSFLNKLLFLKGGMIFSFLNVRKIGCLLDFV